MSLQFLSPRHSVKPRLGAIEMVLFLGLSVCMWIIGLVGRVGGEATVHILCWCSHQQKVYSPPTSAQQ